jgi:hypothetical protein
MGQEIVKLSAAMVMPAPDLDVIGIGEPTRPDILADFWAAVLWTTRVLRSTTQKNLV